MKKMITTLLILLTLTLTAHADTPVEVDLVFTYAISSDVPLYIDSVREPYRRQGIRLEVQKNWDSGMFLKASPYIWGGAGSVNDMGGVVVRFGWEGETWGVALIHRSIHNFDLDSSVGGRAFDGVEFRVKLR